MSSTNNRHRPYLALALAVALITAPVTYAAAAATTNWSADASHTAINFSIKHFFTPVTGSFSDFEIDLDYDAENPEMSTVAARINVASIDTGNERRDNHLRSGDWFEADKHPYMTFKSESVRKSGDNQLIASGPLTIKGTSRQVDLPITLLGTQAVPEAMKEAFGGVKEVASFQATIPIDRGDFGVGVGDWAATMVVGGQVDINILVEAHGK